MGLSFSIPIETANAAVKQLREHGKVSRGLLGVQVGAVSREMAEALDLDRPIGALVNDVTAGSAAEKAGIQPGDVILEFNGITVEMWSDLPPLVGSNPPGTRAAVLVSRNGKEKRFDVTLDALEADEEGNLLAADSEDRQSNALGLQVEAINDDMRRALGNPEGGVVVVRVESDAAYRAGLRAGDVVLMINSEMIGDMDDFDQAVESVPEGKAVALRIMRDGVTRFIAYTPTAEE
jgi:serine protease Do